MLEDLIRHRDRIFRLAQVQPDGSVGPHQQAEAAALNISVKDTYAALATLTWNLQAALTPLQHNDLYSDDEVNFALVKINEIALAIRYLMIDMKYRNGKFINKSEVDS